MDSSELHNLHKSMWNWLARNPSKKKSQWPGWRSDRIQADIELIAAHVNDCFACQDASNTFNNTDKEIFCKCSACPIDWNPKSKIISCSCESFGTIYHAWQWASIKQKAHIARLIANLEWINKEDLDDD